MDSHTTLRGALLVSALLVAFRGRSKALKYKRGKGRCKEKVRSLRRLTINDKAEVMGELSKGIYEGNDYLPHAFDLWIRDTNRIMFGVFDDGNGGTLVGLEVLALFDGGRFKHIQIRSMTSMFSQAQL